jgi:imidazole glycerol-phosphate synthase subunit HisH
VGMQLLYEGSDEAPGVAGLALLRGQVRRIPTTLPLPHVGWNAIEFADRAVIDPLLRGVAGARPRYLYHVHSYAVLGGDAPEVLASCTYEARFAAVVGQGAVWGIQGHPEKSQEDGLTILGNFAGV